MNEDIKKLIAESALGVLPLLPRRKEVIAERQFIEPQLLVIDEIQVRGRLLEGAE